jgi:hypothetical protein
MVAAGMAAVLVPGAVKRARVADGPARADAVEPLVEQV